MSVKCAVWRDGGWRRRRGRPHRPIGVGGAEGTRVPFFRSLSSPLPSPPLPLFSPRTMPDANITSLPRVTQDVHLPPLHLSASSRLLLTWLTVVTAGIGEDCLRW